MANGNLTTPQDLIIYFIFATITFNTDNVKYAPNILLLCTVADPDKAKLTWKRLFIS
jgi:hypothetical protein